MKKLIAVTPQWDEKKNILCVNPRYLDAIRESGAIPVILPLHVSPEDAVQLLSRCHGLLMTGGHDVSPAMYGTRQSDACGTLCSARDTLEQAVYRYAVEQDLAVLGICRGIQTINVFEGGTLYQDIPTEFPGSVAYHGLPPYDQIFHSVRLESALRELLGTDRMVVNTFHHQAIKDLGAELEVMGRADDGIVEAVRHRQKRFVWAVQWHPERTFDSDENSRKIFKALIDACR